MNDSFVQRLSFRKDTTTTLNNGFSSTMSGAVNNNKKKKDNKENSSIGGGLDTSQASFCAFKTFNTIQFRKKHNASINLTMGAASDTSSLNYSKTFMGREELKKLNLINYHSNNM